ncbi:hypothetical protein TCAL_04791 [Tigriopus californicus]|uniref:Uncharacterized protein n=1 Tax=Tigriopus californicus TaxID=6832 RepID=A0A553PS93_TIGCA|nr:hypothetical protein TCAL_04791 [Tigriopus californicus]
MDMANSGPPPVLGAHMMGNLSVPLGSTNLAVASGMTIMTMGLVLENLVKQSDMNSQAHPQSQPKNQNQNYSNFSRRMSKSRNPHRSRKKDGPSPTEGTEFLPTMYPDSSRLPEYLTSPRNYDTVLNYPGYFYSKVGDKSYKNNVSFYNYGLARPDTPESNNDEKENFEPYTFTKRPITNVDEDTHVLAGFENEPLYKKTTRVLAPPKTSVSFMDLSESPFHATNEAIKAKFQPQFGQGSFQDLPEKVKATQEPEEEKEFSTFGQKETVLEKSFSTERGRVKVVRKKVPKVPHIGGFRTATHDIIGKNMNAVAKESDQEPLKGQKHNQYQPNKEFVRQPTRRFKVGPTAVKPSVNESLDIQGSPKPSNPTLTTTAKSVDGMKPTSYSYKDGQSYVQVNLNPDGVGQDPSQPSIPETNDSRDFNVINLGEDEDLFNEDLTFNEDNQSGDQDALYPNTFFHNIPKPTHSHEDLGDTAGIVQVTEERQSFGPMKELEPVRPSKFPNFPIRNLYPGEAPKTSTISTTTTRTPYLVQMSTTVQPSEITCIHEPFAVLDRVKPTNRPTTKMGPVMDALIPEYLDVIQTRKDTIPQLGHGLEDVDKAFFNGLNELKDLHGRHEEDTRIDLGNTDTFFKIQQNFNKGNVLKSEPDTALVHLDEYVESQDEIPEGPLYYGEIVERPPHFDENGFVEDKPDSEKDRDFLKIVDQFENKLVTESNHFKDKGYRRKKHPLPQVIQEHVHDFQENFDTLDGHEQYHDTDGHAFHTSPSYSGSGPGPSSPQEIIPDDSHSKRPPPNQFKFGDFNSDIKEFVTDDREILELTEFPISEEMIFDEPAHLTFEPSGPTNYGHSGPVSDGYDIPEPSYTLDVDMDWQRKHILSKINSRNRLNIPRSLNPPRHKAQFSVIPQELISDNDPGFRRRQEMLLKLQKNNKFQRLLKQYGFDQFAHKPLSRKKKLMLIKRIQQIKRNQLRMAQIQKNGPHLRDRNFKVVHPLNGPGAHHGQRGRPFPRRPQGPIVPLVQTGHRLHKFKTALKVVTPADRKFDVVYPHGVEDDSIISQIARFGNFDNFVIGFLINYVYNRYVRNQFLRDVPAIIADQVPTILNTLGFGGRKRSLNNGPLLDPAVYSIASNDSDTLIEALAMPDDLWRGFSEWNYFSVYDIDSLFTLLDAIEEQPSHPDNSGPRESLDAPIESAKLDQTKPDQPLPAIDSKRRRRETENSRIDFIDAKEYLQKVVYPSMSKNDAKININPPSQSNFQYKEEYMKENADMLQNVLKNQSIQNVIHQIDTKTSDFIKKLISPDTELIKVNDTLQILRIKDLPAKQNNGFSSTQLTTTLNSIRSTQTEAPFDGGASHVPQLLVFGVTPNFNRQHHHNSLTINHSFNHQQSLCAFSLKSFFF